MLTLYIFVQVCTILFFFIYLLENNGMSSTPPILKPTREDEQKTVGYPIETSKIKEEFCAKVVTSLFTFI